MDIMDSKRRSKFSGKIMLTVGITTLCIIYLKSSSSFSSSTQFSVHEPGVIHVLVTGGAGYIGSHASLRLLKNSYRVTIVDNLSRGNMGAVKVLQELFPEPGRLQFIYADLGDAKAVNKIFAENAFDAVMHFAAVAYVGESTAEPLRYYHNITSNTLVVLKAMASHDVKTLIYSSTCATTPPFSLLNCLGFQLSSIESYSATMRADPGELTQPSPTSFDEFQRQTSLMTSCTLLWKELSDHFTSLENDLRTKSDAIKSKIQNLDSETNRSLKNLETRELSLVNSISISLETVEKCKAAALTSADSDVVPEIDDSEGLLLRLRSFCTKMDSLGFWRLITVRKKELESIRAQIPAALADCVDPARFVLEAISEVFPEDKRENKSGRLDDLGWACVLVLESLIPVVVDPIMGASRLLVTPRVKENAKQIGETWKASLEQRGGIENVKTPDVHTFLQHLVTFGIFRKEDLDLYRKLVVGSAWRKKMPKLAVSLGLSNEMPDMIEELISRGQQVDAVHFTYEVGLVDKFPPVQLLKAFLKNSKIAGSSILEDPNNSGRASHLAARKEQSALRAVIKCIEEYKLDAEFPPENLKKRLEQLEKVKSEKKRPAAVPANKRSRASNGSPMPPAKAGRLTNAYVSSFPQAPTFVRSPSHTQYPAGSPQYLMTPPMYGHGSRSPPANHYVYSPEVASPPLGGSYPGVPINYSAYGGYGNGLAPGYRHAYYL